MVTMLAWIISITLGLVGGGFALHFPGSYGNSVLDVGAGVFGLVLGAMNGIVVGLVAWLALRLSRRDGIRVVIAMGLIVGGTHALNDGSSTGLPFWLVQLLAGLVAAGAWAWILRERRPSALAVVGLAWALGLVVAGWSGNVIGLPFTETPIGWSQDHAWDGLITGLVWGSATAWIGLPATVPALAAARA